jgi:Fe(3+) dicitrate transport protein
MGKPSKKVIVSAIALALSSNAYHAIAEEAKGETIEAVVVQGILPDRLESVPGSFNVIDEEDLIERRPFSIQEALVNVPGVNIVGENAFGLGLNIGIRGLNPRRSSRTLVMEDGVPLMLAPYSDPSLHLSTPIERIQRIEVVKGSGQILYGPQTVGGMINFVTRPVPTDGFAGTVQAMVGNNDFTGLYANAGYGSERGGFMFDVNQKKGDGIRDNHDFDVLDVTFKGQINLTDRQTLIAKIGYYEEDSNVTETGLGAVEYAEDKFQAPSGKNDRFELERKSAQLTHIFDITDTAKLTTNAYYTDVTRSSFRQINDSGRVDGRSALERCNTSVQATEANAANCGGRHRPRDFEYFGIEPRFDFQHSLFGLQSDAVIGFRYHEEKQKRRQFRGDTAAFQDLSFAKANSLPREDIAIDVEAKSYYLQNTFYAGDFAITPGVRYEDIRIKTDVRRANGGAQNNPESQLTNNQSKVLPGFGVAWNGIANTTVFAGIHKGFAPPRPDRDLDAGAANTAIVSKTKPEESTNYELGLRSAYFKGINFESTLFLTQFDEIVVEDNGRFFNGGETEQAGFELAGRIDFGTIYDTPHNIYVQGSYTNVFTAEFKKDIPEENVLSGNRTPYAPKHIASLSIGYQHPVGFDARVGVDYVSQQFSDGENTRFDSNLRGEEGTIPSYTLLNASVNYRPVGSKASYFLSGYNLADREFLASRVDGMVAGRGRQVFGGVRYDF